MTPVPRLRWPDHRELATAVRRLTGPQLGQIHLGFLPGRQVEVACAPPAPAQQDDQAWLREMVSRAEVPLPRACIDALSRRHRSVPHDRGHSIRRTFRYLLAGPERQPVFIPPPLRFHATLDAYSGSLETLRDEIHRLTSPTDHVLAPRSESVELLRTAWFAQDLQVPVFVVSGNDATVVPVVDPVWTPDEKQSLYRADNLERLVADLGIDPPVIDLDGWRSAWEVLRRTLNLPQCGVREVTSTPSGLAVRVHIPASVWPKWQHAEVLKNLWLLGGKGPWRTAARVTATSETA